MAAAILILKLDAPPADAAGAAPQCQDCGCGECECGPAEVEAAPADLGQVKYWSANAGQSPAREAVIDAVESIHRQKKSDVKRELL